MLLLRRLALSLLMLLDIIQADTGIHTNTFSCLPAACIICCLFEPLVQIGVVNTILTLGCLSDNCYLKASCCPESSYIVTKCIPKVLMDMTPGEAI